MKSLRRATRENQGSRESMKVLRRKGIVVTIAISVFFLWLLYSSSSSIWKTSHRPPVLMCTYVQYVTTAFRLFPFSFPLSKDASRGASHKTSETAWDAHFLFQLILFPRALSEFCVFHTNVVHRVDASMSVCLSRFFFEVGNPRVIFPTHFCNNGS
jgi:hypothetical protein